MTESTRLSSTPSRMPNTRVEATRKASPAVAFSFVMITMTKVITCTGHTLVMTYTAQTCHDQDLAQRKLDGSFSRVPL